MSGRHAEIELSTAERLVDSRHRQPGIDWPLAVDRWLDERLQQVRRGGMNRATRRELATALMIAHSYTDDELVALLLKYGRLTNGELLGTPSDENVIRFERPKPGPRTSAGS